ncbi:hypothetical protein DJ010_09280 [Nocardioides silvaticus]|uniref:ANTAR domain-containing protein n=1 Tax=Nocardioides silvaticus TaxID=2201891 RepID=A0A316TFP0_9ACTN|nr:ANTAR domain-containing protein [Nocardioides silvaticus]PWN03297.1 hypothetical protein DJ010_09280 [Nocardioides silvaticus]
MSELDGGLTGRFSYDVRSDAWHWDTEIHRIHGLPADIEPTTSHVLGSAAPGDAKRVEELLEKMIETTESFSVAYRVKAGDGKERNVLLVGERALCAAPDKVSVIEGFFVDLTPDVAEVVGEATHAAVEASAEHRAVIEQAKGALMLAYGFDEDAAFSMLSWWSRNRNIKVRDLATELMRASEEGAASGQQFRTQVDRLLHDLTGNDSR